MELISYYLLDLAATDSTFSHIRASVKASAAVSLARCLLAFDAASDVTRSPGFKVNPSSDLKVNPLSAAEVNPTSGAEVQPSSGVKVNSSSDTRVNPTSGIKVNPSSNAKVTGSSGTEMNPSLVAHKRKPSNDNNSNSGSDGAKEGLGRDPVNPDIASMLSKKLVASDVQLAECMKKMVMMLGGVGKSEHKVRICI